MDVSDEDGGCFMCFANRYHPMERSGMKTDICDINGREVQPGDLIRVPHYRDRRTKRQCFIHKLVVLVDKDFCMTSDGKYLYCVDVLDIWDSGSLQKAFKCSLDCIDEFEIIDGLAMKTGGTLQTWYERPKTRGFL